MRKPEVVHTLYLLGILLLLLPPGEGGAWESYAAIAQPADEEVRFPAGGLSEAAEEYAGSRQNWPVVSQLASYDTRENIFTLNAAALARLSRFRQHWQEVQQARQRFTRLIADGGRVFIPDEISKLDAMFVAYRQLISEAKVDESIGAASQISEQIAQVEQELSRQRNQQIEARLTHKKGEVDRRQGLIARWEMADIGTLFERSDGIRTGTASEARLLFLDGSDVLISPQTIATIRESNLDRLTNSSQVEIELSSGSLLTRLSASARNQSNYRLNAGNTSSRVRSNNFWTENREGEQVSMSNFDGEVTVEAENTEVQLAENQGTIVRRGEQPIAPVALLPAPELRLGASGSVIYDSFFELAWTEVPEAAYYEISISPRRNMDRDLRYISSENTRSRLPELAPGQYYIQVRAYDANGLRGRSSPPEPFLRVEDTIAPPLLLDAPDEELQSLQSRFSFTGTTEPEARLQLNGRDIEVGPDGRFSAEVQLHDSGSIQEYTLRATDNAGNLREVTRRLRYIDEEELFQLRWSSREQPDGIERARQMLVSGQAYSFMRVELETAGRRIRQPVGTNGNWAIQFRPGEARELQLHFIDRNTGERLSSRSYKLLN